MSEANPTPSGEAMVETLMRRLINDLLAELVMVRAIGKVRGVVADPQAAQEAEAMWIDLQPALSGFMAPGRDGDGSQS
jgi:hypothetical protein